MTARPHHLRLVVANDDAIPAHRAMRLAWSSAAAASEAPDARGVLLAEAARTVLPPPPARGVVTTGVVSAATAPTVVMPQVPTCGSLWLGGEQLGLLEDLALIRRSRAFAVSGGPAARDCKASPLRGVAYVERLVRGSSAPFRSVERPGRFAHHLHSVRGRAVTRGIVTLLSAIVGGASAFFRRTLGRL